MNRGKNNISFAHAQKVMGKISMSTMVKPIGSACNMDCHYCYYIDKADIYNGKQPMMSDELLEEYIKQYLDANDQPHVVFAWHGGEPLIAGIEFYRKAIELQRKYGGDKNIENTLQTNGVLVSDDWCRFFVENNFLIGISIDGPRHIHDAYRRDKGGNPTFDRVMGAIEKFNRFGVEFNTLSVVNNYSEGRGAEVYNFLKMLGTDFMQFLPAVEHVKYMGDNMRPVIVPPNTQGSVLSPWSVSSGEFGNFLNDIFDIWVMSDVGQYYVQIFDAALAQWMGVPTSLCSFAESCGDALVVEHNGDVYSCDHYVYPQYKLGNLKRETIRELYLSKKQFDFGVSKHISLPNECLRCKCYFACRGECPKHRFEISEDGEMNKNSLCEGYKRFFKHIAPYMEYMAQELRNQRPPANVMLWARERIGTI